VWRRARPCEPHAHASYQPHESYEPDQPYQSDEPDEPDEPALVVELWLRYRQGALYAYVATLITAGMGGMQDESVALEGVRRGVAALSDLETVAALRQSLAS
jgi:hypothetical protein